MHRLTRHQSDRLAVKALVTWCWANCCFTGVTTGMMLIPRSHFLSCFWQAGDLQTMLIIWWSFSLAVVSILSPFWLLLAPPRCHQNPSLGSVNVETQEGSQETQ